MLLQAKIIAGAVLLAASFGAGWSWRASIADAHEQAVKAEASADYADLARARWELQTRLQGVTNELARRNATQAQTDAKAREQVAAAVARYAASHHPSASAGAGLGSDADWLRIHDTSTGKLSVPAPAASRFDDPAATALAVVTHNNGTAVTCQRKLRAWQRWYSGIKKAR